MPRSSRQRAAGRSLGLSPGRRGKTAKRRALGRTRQAPALCVYDLYSSVLVPAELREQLVNVTVWLWLQPWARLCVQGMCLCASPWPRATCSHTFRGHVPGVVMAQTGIKVKLGKSR